MGIFGRLCEVKTIGKSVNICDGLHRVNPIRDPSLVLKPFNSHCIRKIDVDMWATGKQFVKGSRIQILVASGAHPRWIRNYGSKKMVHPRHSPLDFETATIQVFHDADHPSAVYLPVLPSLS